jgi:hypothetical protein
MTDTTLPELYRQLPRAQDYDATVDDDDATDALTEAEFTLCRQIAAASIMGLDDAIVKLRVVRRVHEEHEEIDERLDHYPSIIVRCVRQVLEWLERQAKPPAGEAGP